MKTLVFDTATTRFYTDKKTGEVPRVVRLAWWHSDEPGPRSFLLALPEDATIDPNTVRYHGVTLQLSSEIGTEPSVVSTMFEDAMRNADRLVSFNTDFHHRQLDRLLGNPPGMPDATRTVCVMKLAEPICAIERMKPGGGFKSPSLGEACAHFDIPAPVLGDPLEYGNAVVRAVRQVYEACQA